MKKWFISILMLLTFVFFQFFQLPMMKWLAPIIGTDAEHFPKLVTVSVLATSALMILFLFFWSFFHKEYWTIFDRPRASFLKIIGWGVVGFVAAMIGQVVVNVLTQFFVGEVTSSENTTSLLEQVALSPLFAITIVIVAPLTEEIVFRRAIFGELYVRTNYFIAATISGIIFAAAHMDFTHIFSYLVPAYVFAYVYMKSRSLLAPMIGHFLMNGYVVLSGYIAMKYYPELFQTIQLFLP